MGTLDPFATGLLLCGINQGTRISRFFLEGQKVYRAMICLGTETDTHDPTGRITAQAPPDSLAELGEPEIRSVIASFVGPQDQTAPAFSALKHQGRPLYELARQGKIISKPPRPIEIMDIVIHGIQTPHVDMTVTCSSGTYIRTLAADIGRKLGCGGHLSALCRTGCGPFHLSDALMLEALDQQASSEVEQRMVPLSACLNFLPCLCADKGAAEKIRYGRQLLDTDFEPVPDLEFSFARVTDADGRLLAVVQPDEDGRGYNYSCVFAT